MAFLFLVFVSVWMAVFGFKARLYLISCDVGQGDATLVISGSTQILIDGGPDNKVLDCLGKHLPFWDKKIEAVILTHPEKDHYLGLIDVAKSYQVDNFFTSGLDNSTQDYGLLKSLLRPTESLKEGSTLRLGKIYLDVVYPDELALVSYRLSASNEAKFNLYSLVLVLNYNKFKAILLGDIEPPATDYVAEKLLGQGHVDYIKVPHHGSKNGLTLKPLAVLNPELAVISVGKNSYGHPSKDVIDMLKNKKVEIFRTDEIGDIKIISDGQRFWLEK